MSSLYEDLSYETTYCNEIPTAVGVWEGVRVGGCVGCVGGACLCLGGSVCMCVCDAMFVYFVGT